MLVISSRNVKESESRTLCSRSSLISINLEWTKAALLTAEECKSPILLGVSEGAGKIYVRF